MSKITRRDFVNGTLMVAGASMLPFQGSSQAAMAALAPSYYPPALTGLRGSHPGSNESAHRLALEGRSDWGPNPAGAGFVGSGPTTDLNEGYDLVVVGGGISGLAAAYFFQKERGPDKKVLVLDNHDDFGGHAKRNEHHIDGVLRLGEGGSESLEGTKEYGDVVLGLFEDIGIDLERFTTSYDADFFKRHNLGPAMYFNERVFGEDKIVKHPFCDYPGFIQGLMRPTLPIDEAVRQTPLSEKGKEQLLRIIKADQNVLGVPKEELKDYVENVSYFDYLQNTLGVDDPAVLQIARHTSVDYTEGGTDALSLADVLASGPLGGDPMVAWKDALEDGAYQQYINQESGTYAVEDPFIHHFPDGNATIARLLVRKMIPNVGPGANAEEIVLSKFNYGELDEPDNNARLRLNSTVVNVEHNGDPRSSGEVFVDYINDNKSYRVKGKHVVMACYNMMIPYIVPDLPKAQHDALAALTKVPLQYSTVGLRNWRAMKELGIGIVMCPGNMHQAVNMDYPVSMGGYEYTKTLMIPASFT